MLLTRWNPIAEVVAMDRLLAEAFKTAGSGAQPTEPTYHHLPVDIVTEDGGYAITAPVPGFKPEDVEVTYVDGLLTIAAKRADEGSTPAQSYVCRELSFGNRFRQIAVGQGVDPAGITASFEDGMLRVFVPAPTKPEPHRIPLSGQTATKALKG